MAASTLTDRYRRVHGVSLSLQGIADFGRGMNSLMTDRLPWFQERSLLTLVRRLPVEARRDIQAEYNIGAARVRDHLRATPVRDAASTRYGSVQLRGQWKRGIGLLNFGARQTRKGVSYSVYRGQRKTEAGAFIARLRSGNQHAVQRYGEKTVQRTYTTRKGDRRTRMDQPIAVLYRSSIAQMLAKGRRPERLVEYSARLLEADVRRQVGSYLGSRRG